MHPSGYLPSWALWCPAGSNFEGLPPEFCEALRLAAMRRQNRPRQGLVRTPRRPIRHVIAEAKLAHHLWADATGLFRCVSALV
jgi:hypothetical protein